MKHFFFITFILFSLRISAQVVYEPLHRDVYNFLSRLAQKGIMEYNDQIKPLSRIYIAQKLIEAEGQVGLTQLEKEELDFYKSDFFNEISFLRGEKRKKTTKIVEKDEGGRLRLFSYSDDKFKLNVSPIFGVKAGLRDEKKLTHFWNGLYLYGYIFDFLGFSFDFRDNTESGKTIDRLKQFTPVTGINPKINRNEVNYNPDKIEYNEAKTTISANWSWGNFTVGKEFFQWGYGEGGNLVLSTKAPSFPFIRLDLRLADWISFNYLHAWLLSDVVDSSDIYFASDGRERFHFREKYLASHTLTIFPTRGLNISLGESIVYSDKIEVLYLMPFMFFRLADHYLSRQYNNAGSNAQFFASVSSRNHLKNTHLYGTLFIDEITLNNAFNPEKQRNHFGFTLGASTVDLPIDNLKFTLEYTKILPYVYSHFIQTTSYQSASYNLGHWMGSNADQVYGSLNYRFIRGLKATLWGQYIRKGEEADVRKEQDLPQPAFLSGLQTNYTYFGFSLSYEFVHELFIRADFQNVKTSVEQVDKSFIDSNLTEAYFSIYYGL